MPVHLQAMLQDAYVNAVCLWRCFVLYASSLVAVCSIAKARIAFNWRAGGAPDCCQFRLKVK